MIEHIEIKNLESLWNINEAVIEKDYVIGWLLYGISTNSFLSKKLFFKGGTCIKKCYFDSWRFSEDLDFTIKPLNKPVNVDKIKENIFDVLEFVGSESGINYFVNQPVFKTKQYPFYLEVRIYYRGPRNARIPACIRFDILSSEKVETPAVWKDINHKYSDKLPNNPKIQCYSFDELFAEKIRAMGERALPRDLYDIINLYRMGKLTNNVKNILKNKCLNKNVEFPTLKSIACSPYYTELRSEWENMLKHQLPKLPKIDEYLKELNNLLKFLN